MEKSKLVKTIVMIAIVIICISLPLFLIHNFYLSNLEKLQFEYEIFDNQKRIIETINSYSCDDYSLEIQRAKEKTNKLLIFPETISETCECNGYSYIEEVRLVDMGLQYRAEIYFCIKYSKKGYDDEIVRISSIANSVNGKKVVFSQNLFNYPSYISIYNNYYVFQ